LAIGLFADDKVTLGQAAAIADISQPEFLKELGKRSIPIHYGLDELEQDIATVRKLAGNPQ
jgi:predicted HTH domain antitoxin